MHKLSLSPEEAKAKLAAAKGKLSEALR
jgi:hypothetical protein